MNQLFFKGMMKKYVMKNKLNNPFNDKETNY